MIDPHRTAGHAYHTYVWLETLLNQILMTARYIFGGKIKCRFYIIKIQSA